jgi:uncharacterized membrane protein
VTQPRVRALAARTTSGYRRAWARERLRDSFWPIPGLLLAPGVALAAVTANARALGIPAGLRAGPRVDPGETSTVLGITASATLTFLGVVFTLTLVALQLASSQLSPRVVRQVRFIEPVLAWADILDLAFSEITAFGAGSVQVSRRLLAAYDALEAAVPPARRPGVAARRAGLLQESADQGVSQAGLVPDALGLG